GEDPTARVQPQPGDGAQAVSPGAPRCGLPVVAGPVEAVQGARSFGHDQVRPDAGSGRDQGRGHAGDARSEGTRCRHGHAGPVSSAQSRSSGGRPLRAPGRVRGAAGVRRAAGLHPRRQRTAGALVLSCRQAGAGRRNLIHSQEAQTGVIMTVNNKEALRGLWTSCALAATLLLSQTAAAQTNTVVRVSTTYGDFSIELYGDAAPQNVQNFLNYVNRGAYAGSYFHRLDTTSNNVLQGGGFTFQPWVGPIAIPADPPVPLEYNLPKVRGSIGVARTTDPNSATSQWYINLEDNTEGFGPTATSAGYTVIGAVLGDGMNVVDAIAELETYDLGVTHSQFPLRNYPNEDAGNIVRPSNLVLMNAEVTHRYSEAVSVFEYQSTLLFTSVS